MLSGAAKNPHSMGVWVLTSKEATAPCGRLVMLLDHVFTRDVTVSIRQ